MKFEIQVLHKVALFSSITGIFIFLFDLGFSHNLVSQNIINGIYFLVLLIGGVSTIARYISDIHLVKRKVFLFDAFSLFFTIVVTFIFLSNYQIFNEISLLKHPIWIKIAIFFSLIREVSDIRINYKRTMLNPAQLFVVSFFIIILIGSLLLMLPRATYDDISFIDALFTSTSAVCVTGLIVVDTGTYFTTFGQFIILGLIQIGGLGILTFASYFSYFFKGGSSYENQLALSDMTNSQKLGEVFSTLKYIIIITFIIELVSASLIYSSLNDANFDTVFGKVFFALFHAISAFCNAGFSTLSDGLYDEKFRFNYFMQFSIILTFVFGGLGFPIVSNTINYIKYVLRRVFSFGKFKVDKKPWVLNLNSRITLITTISISIVAFIAFYLLEYNNTLAEHSGIGKIITALFGATTPRTAGFNTIDTASMLFPTTMMIFLLMWIGASPSSTGGGIKTSTFAIATLNLLSLARGKTRIELFRREIADISVRRAFAIISLSLIVIGFGITLISFFDSDKDLLSIGFECFSAYSTVGLSLGITSEFSSPSKIILIGIMFVGRVSMLTIIIALLKKVKHKNYRYPTEEITIN